jgi:serine/threonine protein kinase
VAIKVLPEAFSQDGGRLARFEREARLLAALNHPNIAAIYDFAEHEGVHFLALELVGGETLAERISRGAVPMDEALPLFTQIAEALEAAHEKGIIHRDLKPANIKVTPDGKVKVLDFGLAKARPGEEASQDISQSPTLTRQGTEMGVLLGTAPYMSPEQVRGKPVDKRADIWAFGCVVFEALTGKSAFLGETVSDTLAAVLKQEPDWGKLPPDTPAAIRSLMRRCLQKDPDRRLHDVADARIEIEEALAEPATIDTPEVTTTRRANRGNILWALAGLLVGSALAAALIVNLTGDRYAILSTSRVSINIPSASGSPSVSSPEGDYLVYIHGRVGAREQLYRRDFDSFETDPIPGTEGSISGSAFFSPDGREIGFFVDGDREAKTPNRRRGPASLLSNRPSTLRPEHVAISCSLRPGHLRSERRID